MNETAPPKPFPLDWHVTWPRTPPHQRLSKPYKVSPSKARSDLVRALNLMGQRPIISTNIPLLRNGGFPAEWREPQDPGVAVYWEDEQRVRQGFGVDNWRTLRENLRAATLALEAFRALKRSGAKHTIERTFAGLALPAEAGPSVDAWWDVLGLYPGASPTEIKAAYRERARFMHPDRGGSLEAWNRLNDAYARALPPMAAEASPP